MIATLLLQQKKVVNLSQKITSNKIDSQDCTKILIPLQENSKNKADLKTELRQVNGGLLMMMGMRSIINIVYKESVHFVWMEQQALLLEEVHAHGMEE